MQDTLPLERYIAGYPQVSFLNSSRAGGMIVEAALTMVDVFDEAQTLVLSALKDVRRSWTKLLESVAV